MLKRMFVVGAACLLASAALADDDHWRAHYLANAGVMVAHDDIKILFDPFFRNGFDNYDLMPAKMEADIFAGSAPWNGIDAIFVSHYHGDHFEPSVMLEYLRAWPAVHFYAPGQATSALLALAAADDTALIERIHSVDLVPGAPALEFELDSIRVEALRIAHAGWPDRHATVHNILFRVTLDEHTTVVHMGDADAGDEHYRPHAAFWAERQSDLALPPVWLMLTPSGRQVLRDHIDAEHEIGVHVYSSIADEPARRAPEFEGLDIFTRPGEIRQSQD